MDWAVGGGAGVTTSLCREIWGRGRWAHTVTLSPPFYSWSFSPFQKSRCLFACPQMLGEPTKAQGTEPGIPIFKGRRYQLQGHLWNEVSQEEEPQAGSWRTTTKLRNLGPVTGLSWTQLLHLPRGGS